MAKLKPKGARGRAQVHKLGRSYKTGGFNKIAASAAKRYGSAAAGKRVAGAIFQKMVAKRKGYKRGGPVKAAGPAMLHKGEFVIPKGMTQKAKEMMKRKRLSTAAEMMMGGR